MTAEIQGLTSENVFTEVKHSLARGVPFLRLLHILLHLGNGNEEVQLEWDDDASQQYDKDDEGCVLKIRHLNLKKRMFKKKWNDPVWKWEGNDPIQWGNGKEKKRKKEKNRGQTSIGRNSTRQPIELFGGGGLNRIVCQFVDWIFCGETKTKLKTRTSTFAISKMKKKNFQKIFKKKNFKKFFTSKWSDSFSSSWLIFSENSDTGSRIKRCAICRASCRSIPEHFKKHTEWKKFRKKFGKKEENSNSLPDSTISFTRSSSTTNFTSL